MTQSPEPNANRPSVGWDRRVGVLGHGAIGRVVAGELAAGRIEGAVLSGVGLRPGRIGEALPSGQACSIEDLIVVSDLIVEVAGQQALSSIAIDVLSAGCDLVAVSSGALADPSVFEAVSAAGPGRLYVCSGAVGGIDLVSAAAAMGEIRSARITTTKRPAALVQDRMSEDEVADLEAIADRQVIFDGRIEDLVEMFPQSTNVAATLALAVGSWDVVRGKVVADPSVALTTHVIEMEGVAGSYRFEMVNQPVPDRPRSSAVVPWAVLRTLRQLVGSGIAVI